MWEREDEENHGEAPDEGGEAGEDQNESSKVATAHCLIKVSLSSHPNISLFLKSSLTLLEHLLTVFNPFPVVFAETTSNFLQR